MSRIIAGRFQTSTDAEQAARALTERSIAMDRISIFYVTPPGQHDATPIGGDAYESPGLEEAPEGAGVTGAAVGVGAGIAGALIGATAGLATPMVVVAGIGAAAAGAFGGSLAGALGASEDHGRHPIRHAGMMVAVDAGADESTVVAVLRGAGAHDIESADGTWTGGTWDDFDPTVAPQLVDGARPTLPNPEGLN